MSIPTQQIEAVRAFNRDYTRRIGVLSQGLLDSAYSLTQVRVMYEIAHRPGVMAAELAGDLGLDRGYLSRILRGFEAQGIIGRLTSAADGRRQHLRLTPAGRRVLAPLEQRSQVQVRRMLAGLDGASRQALLQAMSTIRSAFAGATGPAEVSLRGHRPGDMGWVVERHGVLYSQEYGWNEDFEALVAGITVEFIRNLDPARERCWIAESHGRRLGCVFLVAGEARTAKLRLLLVEPEARGLGLGRRLVEECVRFARAANYQRIILWTQANLSAARHLYSRTGFARTARERHRSFGHALIGETWELKFRRPK
ncbi:MAG TPA: helix-turn-helix domain-containing GNAT family N-acetyltransferase [Steroidobacteraceae bacterium]|jgi:DNA-binding MarR family transcriptional regulator/GNAT superfamily N-acetyltransferase|nr:helix-turn-helix domain-containing GNAT family N-acetyltransferase [Steroidobacteraceae bacterium]